VLLKMETEQPVGSFKIRGIGRVCEFHVTNGVERLVSSSGGNAGYAVAYSGRELGIPVDVFVPETTGSRIRDMIGALGAGVVVAGAVWDETHQIASEHARKVKGAIISPFDHPEIWAGHSTMVDEMVEQLDGGPLGEDDCVVVSVGGGGLFCGVVDGLRRHGLDDVTVVTVETRGTNSLARSIQEGRLVTLPGITGIATSLGARTVSSDALDRALGHPTIPLVVSDREAVDACVLMSSEDGVLVEPACGASLAVVDLGMEELSRFSRIIVVVCGGIGVSRDALVEWDGTVTG